MTSESMNSLTDNRLRTPRAAAWAGIISAILFSTSMVLTFISIPSVPPYTTNWLTENSGRITLATTLVPLSLIHI